MGVAHNPKKGKQMNQEHPVPDMRLITMDGKPVPPNVCVKVDHFVQVFEVTITQNTPISAETLKGLIESHRSYRKSEIVDVDLVKQIGVVML